jgi:hypothetical protein
MKTLSFAVAMTMAAALHAEEPLRGDGSTALGPLDPTALIWWPERYQSECDRLDPMDDAYVACLVAEAEKSRQRALRELAWPNPPGRH